MKWDNLTLSEKSELMKLYLKNGITSLSAMKEHYNSFATGGIVNNPPVDPVLKGRQPKANFYQRLLNPFRQTMPDWENRINNQNNVATHKMSWATDDDGTAIVYPEVQEINGKLYDFTDPRNKENRRAALDRAIQTGDTIQMTPAQAEWWTRHYKEFYPSFEFAKGGSLGEVTSLGQWEYPGQVTTIPSNNITMKGVNYPVIGVSNTGDTKYMLPNMDYLFEGQYVTEYPIHKYQTGGLNDNKTYISSQTQNGWMPEVTISVDRPNWQQGLQPWDWSRAKQYYSNPNGTLTSQGFEFLKNVASKRRTGQSNFMRDVNKLSYIPNAAVGAIGAIPAAAGLIASAPVVAEAAAPYVVPAVKSMFSIKNLAGLGLSMGLATGVDQIISDNSNYKSLPDWANQTFFDGSPETEQALEFFRPEYMFAPYTSKVVNKGIGLVNNAGNAVKPYYNSKIAPVLEDTYMKLRYPSYTKAYHGTPTDFDVTKFHSSHADLGLHAAPQRKVAEGFAGTDGVVKEFWIPKPKRKTLDFHQNNAFMFDSEYKYASKLDEEQYMENFWNKLLGEKMHYDSGRDFNIHSKYILKDLGLKEGEDYLLKNPKFTDALNYRKLQPREDVVINPRGILGIKENSELAKGLDSYVSRFQEASKKYVKAMEHKPQEYTYPEDYWSNWQSLNKPEPIRNYPNHESYEQAYNAFMQKAQQPLADIHNEMGRYLYDHGIPTIGYYNTNAGEGALYNYIITDPRAIKLAPNFKWKALGGTLDK